MNRYFNINFNFGIKNRISQFFNTQKDFENENLNDLFWDLRPGASIDLMKNKLGVSDKISDRDFSIFDDVEVNTYSYLYLKENFTIKITSKNNLSIDSITIFPNNNFNFDLNFFPFAFDLENGHPLVSQELLDSSNRKTTILNRLDRSFAISLYIIHPIQYNFTFFGFICKTDINLNDVDNNNVYLSEIIEGICMSYNESDVFFIHEEELR